MLIIYFNNKSNLDWKNIHVSEERHGGDLRENPEMIVPHGETKVELIGRDVLRGILYIEVFKLLCINFML